MRRDIQRWLFSRVIPALDIEPALWLWGTSLEERLRDTQTVGARLRITRQTRGWTQEELAKQIHVRYKVQISDWEQGRAQPSEPWVAALARGLKIHPGWLLWGRPLEEFLGEATTGGRRLRILRQARGYTMTGLATEIGVSRSTLSNWEHDLYPPRRRYHELLAHALQVEYALLRGGLPLPRTGQVRSSGQAADAWWSAIRELLHDPAGLDDDTLDFFGSQPDKTGRLDELNRLFEFLYERYQAAGQVGQGYHRFEHDLEVTYLALRVAVAQGHEGETLLAVLLAGLLHDYDPQRGAARPEVAHTLHHLEMDADLRGFFDWLGLGQEGRWLMRQLILGTEFPLDEATMENIRLQIGTQRADQRWQADTEALVELFALADKAATYLLLTPEEAEERVRQLAHEQGKTEAEFVALTQFFFAEFLEAEPGFGWLLRQFPEHGRAWAA
ncbi:MAG TPA: helix-turn-helix transcriptional regulator, partial [archaeon]|nr:helix-turn-helix transcriptional regulator [archaeon]